MIEVTGKIILDQVYDNGLHSLTRFEIKNATDLKITVKLRSNLTKIAFQKTNENLPDQLLVENTNTVEYCMARTNTGFNQLFNFVGHIDQIDLEPYQTQKIIIAFLPTSEPNTPTIFKDDATHDFIEINGLLFFFCFKKDKLGLVKQDSKAILEKPVVSPIIGRSNTDPAKNIEGEAVIPPDFQVSAYLTKATTKFKSRICKSVFTTDISSTGLIFDDCVVGGTYFKDFTVHNRSEIMLFWILTSLDLSNKNHKNWLKFTDYDTGEPLDFSPLAAYTPKRIRVSFKPTDVGEFNYEIQIENQNDASNTIQTHIHAIVRSVMREEKLVISTGNMLDFGDCCAGLMKKKFIVLRNVSESPLEIGFSSDSPEVVFQLKSDEIHSYEPIRSRQHSKQLSEPIHRDSFEMSDSLLEPPDKFLHDRLTEISAVSRTHSELSITRTHSSSSSVGSSPGYQNADDQAESKSLLKIVPMPNIVEALRSNHDSVSRTMSEDYDSFSSFDLPYNKDVGVLGEEITRIEELILRPGIEKHIEVCYLPQRDLITPDYRSCRLSKRNFRVTLSSCKPGQQNNSEKNIIQCVSKVCTSAIEISPTTINFGDTNVSTLKSAPLIVRNMSDLPTLIELRYVSKVLSSFRGEIVIPAKQSVEVKIDIYPRKVNPDYKKEITVANLFNPDNDQVVQVHSTNIDQQRVTFHSLFYNILTPSATNFIDFGTALINAPVVRTFVIENISNQDLVLELSNSMPGDIAIYGVAEYNSTVLPRNSERKEKLLESIEDRRKLNRPATESKTSQLKTAQSTSGIALGSVTLKTRRNIGDITQSVISPDYLDLASTNKADPPRSPSRRKNTYTVQLRSLRANFTKKNSVHNDDDVSDVSGTYEDVSMSDNLLCKPEEKSDSPETTKFAMDALLPLLEKETGMISPHFSNYEAEEKYVKTQQTIRRELEDCIRDAQLVPLTQVTIGSQKQLTIILVFKSNNQNLSSIQVFLLNIKGKARKYDARVFFKMVEFDRTIKHAQFDYLLKKENSDKIPIRELMVRSLVAKSMMELGQKHINFGNMDKTERRTKKIVIRNKSEVPLIYGIRKSGSIASGDLIFSEGKYGVIRGYGKREVEFMFDPSLAGQFQENLTIENIQNPENNQTLIVKANIRQPANFFIEKLLLSFGPCLIDQICQTVQSIVISNTSTKHTRIFEVKVDPQELMFEQCTGEIWFSVDNNGDDEDGNQKIMISKEMEERIEQLEQKHKIAIRKGRQDKADKILEELKLLRAGKVGKSDNEKQEEFSPVPLANTKSTHTSAKDLITAPSPTVPQKVKTTDCSIIFPIGPRCVKTVKVFFKPSRTSRVSLKGSTDYQSDTSYSKFESSSLPSNPSLSVVGFEEAKTIDSEICTARIYIHEQKNTDIVKRVLVKSTVCYDQMAYLRALQEEQDINRKSETDNIYQFDTPAISSMPSTTTSQNLPQSPMKNFIPEIPTPKFTVEMQLIDLGRLEIAEQKHCYFVLINQSDRDMRFILDIPKDLASIIYAKKQAGILKANETKRIELNLVPRSLGRLKATIHVQDSRKSQKIPVTFIYYSALSSYIKLNFNSEEKINSFGLIDVKQGNYELDFGYCYIDNQKRFAKVVPIELENITNHSIVLSAVSNLSQQCYIFTDSLLENSLSSNPISLNAKERILVYVALQPGLVNTGSAALLRKLERPFNILTDTKLASQIDCRNLIGGIRFMIFVKDNMKEMENYPTSAKVVANPDNLINVFTHTLKFSAAIGQSYFAISDKAISFGSKCNLKDVYSGKFWIYNLTSSMPLQFQLKSSSGILVENYSGHLHPIDTSQIGTSLQGECINFSLKCGKLGFYNETIECRNVNNLNQVFEISIRAFCNPNSVSSTVLNQKRTEEESFDVIRWENIYSLLVPEAGSYFLKLQKKSRTDSIPLYENSIELRNNTDELIQLQAYSDLNLNFRWMINVGSGFVVDNIIQNSLDNQNLKNADKLTTLGSSLLLQPKEKAMAVLSVPVTTTVLDDASFALVSLGKRYLQEGLLVFKNVDKQQEVAAFQISAGYCVSVGNIETSIVDLGKVGHINMWQEVKFQFKILNPSEIGYLYDFDIPDYIEILSIGLESENIPSKRKIEPGGSQVVECQFNPRQVHERNSGAQTGTITIRNIFNPSNDLIVTLKYFMTQFELKFDRLNSGELQLPPLVFPPAPNSLPCDNWFSITNVADQDVKFEMGCTLTPDVESLIFTEILSRNSNSPIGSNVSLPSKGSIEVKIRISAKEAVRLAQGIIASSYLTNPAGVTLGTFWVTSKMKQSTDSEKENTLKLVESVALRGVFVEGPTFALSENSLSFKTIVLSDSDDEKTPQSTTPTLSVQKQTIVITNLSSNFSLDLNVVIEYPIEFASASENIFEISPLNSDGTCQLDPGSQLSVTFALKDSKIYGISDDIKVHFIDRNSLSKKGQTVAIKFLEDNSGRLKSTTEFNDDVPSKLFETRTSRVVSDVYQNRNMEEIPIVRDELTVSPELQSFAALKQDSALSYSISVSPVIEIKGCKKLYDITSGKFEGFYELDLGQQDLSPTALSKKITIELSAGSQASYRICPVNERDSDWIVCNRYEGLLEMSRSNSFSTSSHSITLNLMVTLRGTYYAYLMIQNLDNHMDTKFIRVTMEVVAKQNLKRSTNANQSELIPSYKADLNNNKVFQVYTHAIEAKSSAIDMGMLSFGTFYVTKSIVIFNNELTPLEFSVTSNLPRDDESELIFSLSRSGAKLFSTIRVDAGSSCQVFLRLLLMPSSKIGAQLEDYIEHKNIEIYVNCRLVKDYQKVIPLKALCTPLQMTISPTDYVFSCLVSKKANNEIENLTAQQIQCDNDLLTITNCSNALLEFHIICDSIYFDIELYSPEPSSKPSSPHHRGYNTFTSKVLQYLSGKRRNNDDSSESDEDIPAANTSSLSKLSFSHGHEGLITCTLEPKSTKKYRIIPLLNNINKHIEQLRKVCKLLTKQKYIMDHFVLYNKKKPHERQRLYVRLSFGHLKTFQFASDSLNHFHILESHCIRLLRQISISPSLLNDINSDAFFLYRYIVDELIHYGTREQAAYRYLHLGSLLFKSLFTGSRGLLPSASPNVHWINPFIYFLSFFPRRNTQVVPLVDLAKTLVSEDQI
ncbi:hypothetical protein HDV06_004231 [Boothiomyces sp. JEL0866]|nr:hypothetical protein HDV06_004231 [Boothiomyces sp. JEL0866]